MMIQTNTTAAEFQMNANQNAGLTAKSSLEASVTACPKGNVGVYRILSFSTPASQFAN